MLKTKEREVEVTHGKLEVLLGEAGRELDVAGERLGNRNNIRAVDQLLCVLSEHLELGHGSLELQHHQLLVVCELYIASK